MEQFRKKFWYEPKSNYMDAKNWDRYEELEIDILFKKLRDEYLPIFDQLKHFELIKDILTAIEFDKKETLTEEECSEIVERNLKEKNNFEVLLKQGDILSLKFQIY